MTTSEERLQRHRAIHAKGKVTRQKIDLMQKVGYSNSDIAKELKIPESTLRRILNPKRKS